MAQHFYSGGELQHSDVPYISRWDSNVVQSAFIFMSGTHFLRDVGGVSGTLVYWHSDLTVGVAYPKNLDKINFPHLALDPTAASLEEDLSFGGALRERSKQFIVWGFAGSFQDPDKNDWEREVLMGDVRQLFEDARIPIYDFTSGSSVVQVGTGNSTLLLAEAIAPNAPQTSEEHRFQVTFRLDY